MSETDGRTLVSRFFNEVFNGKNAAAAHEIVAADFVGHHPLIPEFRGPEGILQVVAYFRTAFPDAVYSIDALLAENDLVAARWSAKGTHQGEFMKLPATGRRVSTSGNDVFRVRGGMLVEAWVSSDVFGILKQLEPDRSRPGTTP